MSLSLSKRKFDDYDDDYAANLNRPTRISTRMRKDQNTLPSSSSPRSSLSDPTRIQFFVRMLSNRTLVLMARSSDTIHSIHEKLQSSTGMPIMEQRLIYRGKQLQWEQTLHKCGVENDAELHLVDRMRSTGHPQAWQLINEVVSVIFYLYKNNPPAPLTVIPAPRTVKTMLIDFLAMIPRADADQAYEHLKIFTTSSAPQALVMLYMSSYQANRDAADDAIRQFISSCKTVVPKHTHDKCVHIFLEFCDLLRKAAGTNDPLYGFCRTSLGTMVECTEVWERKGLLGLHDIFPFVRELAAKLAHDLVLSGPSMKDVRDFTAFLVSVRNEIKGNVAFCGLIGVPLSEELYSLPLSYAEEITYLHGVFVDLLNKLDKCMAKIEERVDLVMKPDGETQYLAILKVLNNISNLYIGCKEMFWKTMKLRKGSLCYLIVRYAKRDDDHKWITECKEVTNFEARRHLAMMMLPEVKDEYEELLEMLIERSNLLAESFMYITRTDSEALRAGLFMEFKNEEATGPGVLCEWFFFVCQAIFNPQNDLFVACPNDRRRFFPNPASKVDPLHLEYYSFAGRVIALALMHKVQVGITFDRVFFLQLAGHKISLEDIRDADPYLYSSCKQILEMDSEAVDQYALGLTFVHEIEEELGTRKVVELCAGGKNMVVNSTNRKLYVDSLVQHRFVKAVGEQVNHFAQGFADIMSNNRLQKSFFQILELEDLDWMLLHGIN